MIEQQLPVCLAKKWGFMGGVMRYTITIDGMNF